MTDIKKVDFQAREFGIIMKDSLYDLEIRVLDVYYQEYSFYSDEKVFLEKLSHHIRQNVKQHFVFEIEFKPINAVSFL